jgi:hypothetical protein
MAAAAVLAAAILMSLFWPRLGPDVVLSSGPRPSVSAMPFVSQAEEAAYFDPLADQASLGAIVEVAERRADGAQGTTHAVIQDVVAGSAPQ